MRFDPVSNVWSLHGTSIEKVESVETFTNLLNAIIKQKKEDLAKNADALELPSFQQPYLPHEKGTLQEDLCESQPQVVVDSECLVQSESSEEFLTCPFCFPCDFRKRKFSKGKSNFIRIARWKCRSLKSLWMRLRGKKLLSQPFESDQDKVLQSSSSSASLRSDASDIPEGELQGGGVRLSKYTKFCDRSVLSDDTLIEDVSACNDAQYSSIDSHLGEHGHSKEEITTLFAEAISDIGDRLLKHGDVENVRDYLTKLTAPKKSCYSDEVHDDPKMEQVSTILLVYQKLSLHKCISLQSEWIRFFNMLWG